MFKPFSVQKSQLITATTTSQEVALTSTPYIMIVNSGTAYGLVQFGSKGVVATSNSIPCPPSIPMIFVKPANCEFVALIASTGTVNMSIIEGWSER